MSFIKDLVKSTGNEYAGIVSDGVAAGDVGHDWVLASDSLPG